jgi:hypothetical protein
VRKIAEMRWKDNANHIQDFFLVGFGFNVLA